MPDFHQHKHSHPKLGVWHPHSSSGESPYSCPHDRSAKCLENVGCLFVTQVELKQLKLKIGSHQWALPSSLLHILLMFHIACRPEE
jgi:hypothetical protein